MAFIGVGIIGNAYARDEIPLQGVADSEVFAEPDHAPRRDHALFYAEPPNTMVTPAMTFQALSTNADPASDPHWGAAIDATDGGGF